MLDKETIQQLLLDYNAVMRFHRRSDLPITKDDLWRIFQAVKKDAEQAMAGPWDKDQIEHVLRPFLQSCQRLLTCDDELLRILHGLAHREAAAIPRLSAYLDRQDCTPTPFIEVIHTEAPRLSKPPSFSAPSIHWPTIFLIAVVILLALAGSLYSLLLMI